MKIGKILFSLIVIFILITISYAYNKCYSCDGIGIRECIYCNGEGYTGQCYLCNDIGTKIERCSSCDGHGFDSYKYPCYSCDGTGMKIERCLSCNGKKNGNKCKYCNGYGLRECDFCNGEGQH